MGTIKSESGKEKLLRILAEDAAIQAKYPDERLKALNEALADREATEEEILIIEELQSSRIFADQIKAIVTILDTEYMGMEAVDGLIVFGATHWNMFALEVGQFLANQLWRLDEATMSEEDGMAYIQTKLNELAPTEGYEIRLCDCEGCKQDGNPTVHITNAKAREKMRERPVMPSVEDMLGMLVGVRR